MIPARTRPRAVRPQKYLAAFGTDGPRYGKITRAGRTSIKDGGEDGSVLRDVELKPGELLDLGEICPTPNRGRDTP
jgi:hypothetical protein